MQSTPSPAFRYRILALLFLNVAINYMDRSNISVAATSLSDEFSLSPVELGYIFSAFGWTYVAFQIPGGFFSDVVGPRILYAFSLVGWSLVTLLHSLAAGFTSLLGLRLAVGFFEAPSYPMNNKVVTAWFPDNERAFAIATYTSGQYIGLALLTPAMIALEHYVGWRGLFISSGVIGVLAGIIWYFQYRDPAIKQENTNTKVPITWNDVLQVLSYRKLWGIYLGQFGITSTLYFFLTWFPVYLVKYRGFDFLQTGTLAPVPFLFAFAGILLSGSISDRLARRNIRPEIARKVPVIIGLVFSIFIVGANYVSTPWLVVMFMSIAFFGNGVASISWVFVSLLAPKDRIGITGGVFNFIGNLSSITIPAVIGWLVKDGDFSPALVFIGAMTFFGIACYIFLVGKIERVTGA